jgi:hypothetical protein
MIDIDSHKGSWAAKLSPTRPSLRVLTDKALHDPKLTERVRLSHGLATQGEALAFIGAEKKRRTEIATWDGTR